MLRTRFSALLLYSMVMAETDIKNILFPNRTASDTSAAGPRRLKGVYTTAVPCVTCQGLKYCSNLNGYLLEEVYSPNDLIQRDTCVYLDSLGQRLNNEIFGQDRTFRDTAQCRSIVLQYLCLFW